SFLGARRCIARRIGGASLDPLTTNVEVAKHNVIPQALEASRLRSLQTLGVLCGFAAGAWLGAAEAPTKFVQAGVSPIVVSLLMVIGVFLARWSLPALIRGTGQIRMDAVLCDADFPGRLRRCFVEGYKVQLMFSS